MLQAVGTPNKFEPVKVSEFLYKLNEDVQMHGETCAFSSKFQYQNISCMAIYSGKSPEELRAEDYHLHRKGVNITTSNIFGGTSTTTTGAGFKLGGPLTFGNNTATSSANSTTTTNNIFGSTSAGTGFKFTPLTFGNNTTTSTTPSTTSFASPFRTPSNESMDTTSDGPIYVSPFPNSASQLITFNKPNPFQIQTNPFQVKSNPFQTTISTSPFTSQTQFKIGLGNSCSPSFPPSGQNNPFANLNNQNRYFNCVMNNNNCNQSPFGQQTQLYMVLRPQPIWGFTFTSQTPIFNQNLKSIGIDHNRQIVIPSVSPYTPAQVFGVQPYPDLPPFRYSSYDLLSKPKSAPVRSHISWTDNILRSKSRPYLFSYDTELKNNYEKIRVEEKKPSKEKEELFSQNFYYHGRNVGSPSLSSLFYPKNWVRKPTPTIWFPSISADLKFGRYTSQSTNTESYPMMSEPPRSNDDIFPPRINSSPLYRTNSYIFKPRNNNLSSPTLYTRTSWKTLDYPKVKDLMKKDFQEMESRESKRKFERQNEGSPFCPGKINRNQSLGSCGDNSNSNTSATSNGSQTSSSGYDSFSKSNSNEDDWEFKRTKMVHLNEFNDDMDVSQDIAIDEKNADFIRRPTKEERPSQVVLTKQNEGYYCIPDVKELDKLTLGQEKMGDGLETCLVENFKIGQKNVGFIIFPGTIDVYGLNLNEIESFVCRANGFDIRDQRQNLNRFDIVVNKLDLVIRKNLSLQIVRFNVWPLFGKETPMAVNNMKLASKELKDMKDRIDAFCSRVGGFLVKFEPEMGTFIFKFK